VQQISTQIDIRSVDIELHTIHFLEEMIFGEKRATEQRLKQIRKQRGLLLIAFAGNTPVGFKVGYVNQNKQTFFSWLGGVHPDFRRQGIAQTLLDYQEGHVKSLGINKIYFTSFHRFPEMINLGKKNGYLLTKAAKDDGEEKYWYEKQLT